MNMEIVPMGLATACPVAIVGHADRCPELGDCMKPADAMNTHDFIPTYSTGPAAHMFIAHVPHCMNALLTTWTR